MNLKLVHELLAAVEAQPYGFLKVRGAALVREVELMTAAGLVEASLGNTDTEVCTMINRITDSGHVFLRAFRSQSQPRMAELASTEN